MATSPSCFTNSSASAFEEAKERLLAGDIREAQAWAAMALEADPENAAVLHLAGLAHARADDFASAAAFLNRAIALRPTEGRWLRDLGAIHSAACAWPEAADAFARALALAPADIALTAACAGALLEAGLIDRALAVYEGARAFASGSPVFLEGWAKALTCAGRYSEAIHALEAVAAPTPAVHELLGDLYTRTGHYHLARRHWRMLSQAQPDNHAVQAALASADWTTGDLEDCLTACRKLVRLGVATRHFHSFYLSSLLHDPSQTAATIRAEHEAWAEAHCPPSPRPAAYPNAPDPERRLKIGYLSGEFFRSPAFHFLGPILRRHNPAEVEVFCYHTRPWSDDCTAAFEKAAHHWRVVDRLADTEIIDQIRRDRIDILVDLSGHYNHHRLTVFAARPAPLSVSLPNYPGTTGLAAIDYILTDPWTSPPGSENEYTEKTLRIPYWYLPYEPPPVAPAVTPLPAQSTGVVTFGLFQRPAKLNAGVWDAAASALARIPGSRLLIHYPAHELDAPESEARHRLRREFESRGVSGDRIEFRGSRAMAEHLALLAEVDIALDSFPYNGQTTTCECLWMGVPVVTLAAERHVGRVGASLLHHAGLGHLIAGTAAEYAQKAVDLASDLVELATLRSGLRSRVRRSPLVDGAAVTAAIEAAYRSIWRRWCAAN